MIWYVGAEQRRAERSIMSCLIKNLFSERIWHGIYKKIGI